MKTMRVITSLLVMTALIFAQGGRGKIRGVVTDQETGEVLVGANVSIEGTSLGASTDLNGVYVVLAIPTGTYTVQVGYIGYREVALSNIRVSENQTTTQDFQLAPSAIEVDALQIVAERPLIQRNTTNTVRITTQEDIQNMPVRGLQNLIALEAGTVLQDGELHIRGGRTGEVAYYIDGVSAMNPMYNSENVTVIQEALEEVQMQAGGYTAEFGGGNSGIVRSTLRSGGSQINGSVDFRTDGFADPGEQFLGTSSYGYSNGVVTLSGPLVTPKLRFFVAGQFNNMDNRSPSYVVPFDTRDFIDPVTGQALGTLDSLGWLRDDGYEGREAGEALPGNSHIAYLLNDLPDSWRKSNMFQGTLTYDLTNSIKLRFTGTVDGSENPASGSTFYTNLQNSYFNGDRTSMVSRDHTMMGFRATHILNEKTFYELGLFYTDRSYKNYDKDFGDDWKSYADSVANFEKFGATGWRSRYLGPGWISTINNFEMEFTISKLSSKQKKMVAEQLQGSNTVIVPLKTGFVHPIISGQDETIGLRIPNHNFGIDLVNQLGKPITTTSVNHSGMPPLNKVDDIMELFGSSFDLLIDAGDLPPSKGSKVIKLEETHFEIIRK